MLSIFIILMELGINNIFIKINISILLITYCKLIKINTSVWKYYNLMSNEFVFL